VLRAAAVTRLAPWFADRKVKNMRPDYYEIPELEETEFALAISPCPRIEDFNDLGEIGDSFSIGMNQFDDFADV
jgi:hypothetical protein